MLTEARGGLLRILRREPWMIAREVVIPGLAVGAYAALVVFLHSRYAIAALPMSVTSIVGMALAILLGFRTSSAYNRWWEARALWGGVVTDSRTLARQAVSYLGSKDSSGAKRIVYRQIAWCYGMRAMLLDENFAESLAEWVEEEEVSRVQSWRSIPGALLAEQGIDIETASLTPMRFVQLDRTLARLAATTGKCERINNTPFPLQYDAMVSQVIGLFALLLPLALVTSVGYATIPLSMIVVATFRMMNGVARVLQSPFSGSISDTPMLALCRTIEIDLRQQLGETSAPPPIQPQDGILR